MLDTMHNILEKDGGVIVKNVDLSPLKGKSILITGATGLIGMNIVASLKALCKKSDGPKKIVCAVHSPILNLKESIFNFPEIEIASGDLSEGINFLNILWIYFRASLWNVASAVSWIGFRQMIHDALNFNTNKVASSGGNLRFRRRGFNVFE